MTKYDNDDPKLLEKKITIALLYYGSLRGCELLMVTLEDIQLYKTDNVKILFPHPTKRSTKGFSFTILTWLKSAFLKYRVYIPDEDSTKRLSTNFKKNTNNGKGRVQKMGGSKISNLVKDATNWLHGKEYTGAKRSTAYSFHRSRSTALAEGIISVVVIFHAGSSRLIASIDELPPPAHVVSEVFHNL